MKKFLAFNSIFGNLEAVLFSDVSIIDYSFHDSSESTSEILGDFLEDFLKKNKIFYKDLDFLVFLNGPSSFIKIRNGISHAFGIKFALGEKIQLLNLNLFDVYQFLIQKEFEILRANLDEKKLVIILKSFGGSVFVQHFDISFQKKIQKIIKLSDFWNFFTLNDFDKRGVKFLLNSSEVFQKILDQVNFDGPQTYSNHEKQNFDEVSRFFLENHSIFDSSKSLILSVAEMLIKTMNLNEKFDESFFQIKPFYLFNPEFRKISEKNFNSI